MAVEILSHSIKHNGKVYHAGEKDPRVTSSRAKSATKESGTKK